MSFFFRTAYLLGFKPWDSGVPPPELVAAVEAERLPTGKALDLGCGTGTNCVYLAKHGWDATGVDFVPRAIDAAKRKAAAAGVSPRFIVGDVTRLTELGLGADYRLLFDLGCFHSLPDTDRDAYVRGANAVSEPGATYFLYCFVRGPRSGRFGPRGLERGEAARRFASGWEILTEQWGPTIIGFDTVWYRLRRR